MNPYRSLICAVLIAPALATAADTPSRDAKTAALSRVVSGCLVMGCQVFRGVALNESPKTGEPVPIRVDDWMHGQRPPGSIIDVPYADESARSGLGTPGAWGRIGFKVPANATLTLAICLKNSLEGPAGSLVFVTADAAETALVRSLLDVDQRLRANPALLQGEVASLPSSHDPALAGYLIAYLTEAHANYPKGQAWDLLFQMLDSPGVPGESREGITAYLIGFSGGAPPGSRTLIAQRFIEMAQRGDPYSVYIGLDGISLLSQLDKSLLAAVSPVERNRLVMAYRGMIAAGKMGRNRQLEAVLGIQ